jgi:hypothetical protein
MEKVKVKELKDDASLNIPVNKSYYLMVKAALFSIYLHIFKKKVFLKKV